ncbi:MAG: SagB/ThcOx family dehydrogenase [Planctomycetota bacterium]
MYKRIGHGLWWAAVLLAGAAAFAEGAEAVKLPPPEKEGGKPLMQALAERRSTREFSPEKLTEQVLSNLLWAADGVNREDGRRTAPSAMNAQEIDIYVVTADGVSRYDAKAHALVPILAEDVRELAGKQPFVKEAPVNLVYVADYARIGRGSEADKDFYAAADTGFISQNVYLFCASEGLATVVRGSVDRAGLTKAMKLEGTQRIMLAQTVGHPKKK